MTKMDRRPQDDGARGRLREAQRAEAAAVLVVHRAEGKRDQVNAARAQVLAAQQRHCNTAELALATARAGLVAVSGIDRAARLLDLGAAALRAAVKSAAASPAIAAQGDGKDTAPPAGPATGTTAAAVGSGHISDTDSESADQDSAADTAAATTAPTTAPAIT